MPNVEVPDFFQALTANGDTTGYATVADSSGFYAGAIAYITGPPGSKRCVITEVKSATLIGLRFISDDNEQQGLGQIYGGRSNLTGYTTAGTSKVFMERQLAKVEFAYQSLKTPNV
jgi:hypothetical protein